MAKKQPAAPPRRTVRPLEFGEVQPGASGASLASVNRGTATQRDLDSDADHARDSQIQKREAFLALARRRFRQSADAESELRDDMLEDVKFYNSEQWPANIRLERILDGRPVITINRLPQFVRQVSNAGRKNRPSIVVNPVDNGADIDTAEVLQGVARNIERNSKAGMAYTTAGEQQAIMGRGFLRMRADFPDDQSFEQEIKIEAVEDQFTVYPDPNCGMPDYSDARFGFIVEKIPKHEFALRYPDAEPVSAWDFTSIGDDYQLWWDSGSLMVAEYYYIETVKAQIADVVMFPGRPEQVRLTMDRAAIKADDLAAGAASMPRVMIIRERETYRRQLRWATINGVAILEGNDDKTAGMDLPGPFIPIIPMIGEKLVVNGRKNLRGMVRDAKDPQRAYNFWVSAETEMIALAPRAPVIGAAGQFEGHEEKWNQANRRNYSYLEYNPQELNGAMVPPPQRAAFDPNIGPIIQATMQADRDLKSVVGMFDASQEHSQEQSGKAIIARQRQGEEGNSHFLDNQARAIEHIGRILLHWIPVYYDRPRMMRILGADEEEKDVLIHAGQGEAAQQLMQTDPLGKTIKDGRPFDLSLGRYDVTITTGPSYESRRQESVEALIQLVQAYPALLPVIGDILVGNMDWPGAKQLSARLKKMVPKEARDPEVGQPPMSPEVQEQLQMLQMQLEQATQVLQEKDQIIQTKAQELGLKEKVAQAEIAGKVRIEEIHAQAKQTEIQIQAQADAQVKMTTIQAQTQATAQLKLAELQAQGQAAQMKLETDARLKQAELQAQGQAVQIQAQADARLAAMEIQMQAKVDGAMAILQQKLALVTLQAEHLNDMQELEAAQQHEDETLKAAQAHEDATLKAEHKNELDVIKKTPKPVAAKPKPPAKPKK